MPSSGRIYSPVGHASRASQSTGELILDSSSLQMDLRRLVDGALHPFVNSQTASRVSVAGPALSLCEQTAGSLALALRELAANALKYGALRSGKGTVSLRWVIARARHGEHVCIEWKEHSSDPVGAPASRGFGSRVIAAAVSNEIDGRSDLQFEPDGLRCRFQFVRTPQD